SGRSPEQVRLVEAYMKAQGLFHTADSPEAEYSDILELDLGMVEPSLAGPRRPQDRVRLGDVKRSFQKELPTMVKAAGRAKAPAVEEGHWESEGGDPRRLKVAEPEGEEVGVPTKLNGHEFTLRHGSVVIAAITSCTNTSNPSVMLAAGLLAKKAVERGLTSQPWVKTSLAPGSKVVTDYLKEAGLDRYLETLRFHVVGYGCTTCIGNSGPLPKPISRAIHEGGLVATSVLSGNRNFEGRIHGEVRANYLASPPLVVAYALAGRVDINLTEDPLGLDKDGKAVLLREIWPTEQEVADAIRRAVRSEMFRETYEDVFTGDERWRELPVPGGDTYAWDEKSTYVKHPPYFVDMPVKPAPVTDIFGARALAVLGDSITTDHISPAGSIHPDSPAGQYLQSHGVGPLDFNSYGSRRGNHEVMMRGTFANVRLRNQLAPGTEGGVTLHLPDGEQMSIFDAAMKYLEEGVPLVILAGKEYGSGSSRDWAAKGPRLLGVRAVIAESYERIHRSNLVGMGIVPLEFKSGESAKSLGLSGHEIFDIVGLAERLESGFRDGRDITVRARRPDGSELSFTATVRIDTPQEVLYYRHGGILHYVLRKLLAETN
ncbi:MAG: aconitate hydratase, partial [Candidatus Methylomirabilales bacterium]